MDEEAIRGMLVILVEIVRTFAHGGDDPGMHGATTAGEISYRSKLVALHTVRGIERKDCEKEIAKFKKDNPQVAKCRLIAEWRVREVVYG